MTKEIRNILIGVLIGAVLVAGGQYAWSKYQASKTAKDMTVSIEGFNAAKDKTAYFNNFFAEKAKSSGVSVGLSTSSAYNPDEGEGDGVDSAYCVGIAHYIAEIQRYIYENFLDMNGNFKAGITATKEYRQAWDNFALAWRYYEQAGCSTIIQ